MQKAFQQNLENTAKFSSPEEEIAFLRSQLEYHSQDKPLDKSFEKTKEKVADKIVEIYKETPVEYILHEDHISSEEQIEGISLPLSPEAHDSIIEDLYAFMLENGVKNTLEMIKKMNNQHVEDDFHRFLVQYLAGGYEVFGSIPRNIKKSLGMRMFEIVLPNPKKEDEEKDYKRIVTLMEQFMAGMQSVADDRENNEENYYSLEIAKEEGSYDMSLYVTVPKHRGDLFEKHILSLFEDVRVTEIYDDYNIFPYDGVSSAAYGEASRYDVLQMKTYDDFDHDPMKVIVNAFSKLNKENEGASVQFIVKPVGDFYIKEYGNVLDKLKKGKKIKEALDDSIINDIGRGFKDVLFNKKKEEENKEKKLDDNAIESITEKLKSTILQTNIRIITSSKNKNRSDELLHDLKSAFQQFDNTKGNGISFKDVSGDSLNKLIDDFIFRIFTREHIFKLNLKELATLFHFPLSISSTSQLKQSSAKIAPAPPETPQEGIILGLNKYRHREKYVHMAPEDRLRHFYVIGQTGTGKTHILKTMIIQDILNGDGVCFIDPHGSDIQDILNYIPPERIDDVIYFDPAYTERPMGLNMLDYDIRFPEQKSFVINELMSIFNKLFDMKVGGGAMFEQYFRNSAGLVMEHPESGNTLLEIGQVLANKSFRDMKLRYCRNPIIKQFWANAEKTTGDQGLENFVPYITSKFDVFISNEIMRPVVAQQHSSFNFREIMDKKKILLVNLSKGRLGEINANLIGLVLVGKILMAALSRVDSLDQKLPPFYLYIDEFQNVSTDSISSILSEARKYGLGLIIAHQYIKQLDEKIKDSVFGNVGTTVSFRISSDDAQYLEKKFTPTFTADDIMKIPNRNAYIQMIGHGKPLEPFNIATLPLDFFAKPNPKGVSEKIKQLSYHKYGKDRKEVEENIMRRYV